MQQWKGYKATRYNRAAAGVQYSYFIKDSRDGRFISGGSIFESSGKLFSHGLYYGAGGPSQQGDRSAIPPGSSGNAFEYSESPIDQVDALARTHDMTYDEAGAEDFHSDPRGLAADIAFVAGLENYLEQASQEGYVDSYTKKAPSKEAINSAKIAVGAFKTIIANKVDNLIKEK